MNKKKMKIKVLPKIKAMGLGGLFSSLGIVGASGTKINPALTSGDAMGKVMDLIFYLGIAFGGGLIAWGVVNFGLNYASQNQEKKAESLNYVIGGLIAAGAAFILRTVGFLA